jgi:hypothetical protein
METNKAVVEKSPDQGEVQGHAASGGVVAPPHDASGEDPTPNPCESKDHREEAVTVQEPLSKSRGVSHGGETNTEGPAKPHWQHASHHEPEATKVDSAQLEAQILEARAELNYLEQTADRFASDRSQMKTMLQPENVLAPMPHLLGDVEKIFETVAWNGAWHSSQSLGYYNDLAINSMTRHLARLKDEKDQLGKLESEMLRLRTIEKQYNAMKSQTARDRHTQQEAQGRVPPTGPTASDLPAEQGADTDQQQAGELFPNSPVVSGQFFDQLEYYADKYSEVSGFLQTIPKINPIRWLEFKLGTELNEILRPFAIDTLVGDPEVTFEEERSLWWLLNSAGRNQGTRARPAPTPQNLSMVPGQTPLPERIRVNSEAITTFLNQVFAREPLMSYNHPGFVMIRPYRTLVCFQKEIEDAFSKRFSREERSQDHNRRSGTTQSGATATKNDANNTLEEDTKPVAVDEDPVRVTEETETQLSKDQCEQQVSIEDQAPIDRRDVAEYNEIKCLLEFMNKIKEKIDYIESPGCQDITYADLWYMFKPGDEVISENLSQVYRIVDVTGIVHKVTPPWQTLDGPNTAGADDARLHCVYIAFDGRMLGPVSVHFRIPRWDGEKPVKSLPVVPLRYAVELPKKDSANTIKDAVDALRNEFISHGRMYLDASTSAFRHMHYSGFTLERDEVDSHVVIDFKEAILSDFTRRPVLDNLMALGQKLGGQLIGEKKLACKADCCKADDIFDDGPAEQKRSRDYLASLIPDGSTEEPPCSLQPRDSVSVSQSLDKLSDSDLVIMASTAPGFVLRSRKWGESYQSPKYLPS